MPGYPIDLDLRGRSVLVVGWGAVGRRKAVGLVEAGARVVVVDPAPGSPILDGVRWLEQPYRAGHLAGMALAFAAATPEVNQQVVADAKQAGVWVNAASDPASGDFQLPAVWRDGCLTLTVSTGGASPALAAALRDRAAEALGPSAAGLAAVFQELRTWLLAHVPDSDARSRLMADWSSPAWLVLFESGGASAVRNACQERLLALENGL